MNRKSDGSFFVSAEAMMDMIAWSPIPNSYDSIKKAAYDKWVNKEITAQECCDILGIKHSYDFHRTPQNDVEIKEE